MSYGIRVRNDAFTTQIDHNFKNYGFVQIIPVTVSYTSPSSGGEGLLQVTVPGLNALVGVRCQTLFFLPLGSYFDGANWLYTFQFLPEFLFTGTISETVQLYVFNSLEAGGLSSVGIRIRNPVTAEIAFHSDMRPLTMEALNPCTTGFSGVPGQVYCPIVTRQCFINTFYSGVGYRHEPYGLRCSGSTIEVKQLGIDGTGFFSLYDPGEYAVINVTGLS